MGPLSQPVFCNSASELKKARTTQRSDGNSVRSSHQGDASGVDSLCQIPPSELAMRYAQYFWIVFWTVSCLGTHRIIRKRWGLRGDHSFKGFHDHESLCHPAVIFLNRMRWYNTVRKMFRLWKSVWICQAVILPLSVSVLQIGGIISNTLTRTLALVSIIFACVGLLTSVVYSSQRIKFQRTDMVKKWKKVFLDLESAESVEFWACIALPFASLIWSTLFFISTAIAIAWGECKTPSDSWSPPEPAFCASGAAVTLILLLCTTQVYRSFGVF